jgi:hypothetical protein
MVNADVDESQLPYLFAVKYYLPCLVSSIILFSFGRVIFMRLNLINEKSIGGIFDSLEEKEES